jgi:hypothetical protein
MMVLSYLEAVLQLCSRAILFHVCFENFCIGVFQVTVQVVHLRELAGEAQALQQSELFILFIQISCRNKLQSPDCSRAISVFTLLSVLGSMQSHIAGTTSIIALVRLRTPTCVPNKKVPHGALQTSG